jgi:CBS-domain-containing membrane protein
MTTVPSACRFDDFANEAARIMWERDCGAVPIVDADGRVAGIVTDRDICMAAFFQGAPLSAIRVAEVMSRDLSTCQPHDDLRSAEILMRQRQVHRLPVVDDRGSLVGMLSLSDVAQAIAEAGSSRQSDRDGEEFIRTVSAICQPRTHRNGLTM